MAFSLRASSICIAVILVPATVSGQDRPGSNQKQATAVRVGEEAIRLDGRLDEQTWTVAPAIDDFVQKEPIEGAAPTERMEVRFAFDDGALYVGARMFSREPSAIQAPMGRRDDVVLGTQSEHIFVSFDTFLDRRTAYTFGVSASGVRLDRFHPRDDETAVDVNFDPVWAAETQIDGQGWTAEFWIPFSQLRFHNQSMQTWGLNVRRFTPTLDEQDYWVLVPRTERAWASRFGELRGIQGIPPTRRLELLPFVAGSSTLSGQDDPANPFDEGLHLANRIGLDMKMGLGPSLTLQATINPDFAQVDADPAEVNLTAFPTRFTERRTFFTEDSQILSIDHPNFFYSRRIGARPQGPAPGDYVDYPSTTTILGAARLTGRIRPRTSLGVLAAVTNDEFARVADAGVPGIRDVRVNARATYGVARLQQEFGQLGSTASVMFAGTHRAMDDDDPLADRLTRHGYALSGEAVWRFKGGEYEWRSSGGGTFLNGNPRAIEFIQRSNIHYAQRPDRNYWRLDPTRTGFPGGTLNTQIEKLSGRHWLWFAWLKMDSPGFNPNDYADLRAADGFQPRFMLEYRETQPGRIFRAYSIRVNQGNEWNWGMNRQLGSITPTINLTWNNFWTTTVGGATMFRATSASLTRGGPLMGVAGGWTANAEVSNSASAQTRWTGGGMIREMGDGARTRRINGSVSFRPGPRWQLSVEPTYEQLIDTQQYVTTRSNGRPETFGNRYIFANIDRSTFSSQFRLSFTFKPDLNLDVYAEPFAASGRYYQYGELLVSGNRERLEYGTSGTTAEPLPDGGLRVSANGDTFTLPFDDFNVRSFRSNFVLRYEWRPGSTLYFVWQQDRQARESIGSHVGFGDMFSSVTEPGSNVLLIKTSFWLPVR